MFATLFIPHFELQAVLRHEPAADGVFALVESENNKAVIIQVNAAAATHGVHLGLTPNQARARCAATIIKARSAAQEQVATDVLLQTAYAFSPHIEATAPGVCTIDLRGLDLPGDVALEKWAQQILASLNAQRLHARIGFAPTPTLAALAAASTQRVCAVRDREAFLMALPLQAAGLPFEIETLLGRWGLRFVGELLAIERSQLADRLGAVACELFDHLALTNLRPLTLVTPPEDFVEGVEFETEVETIAPLLFMLQRFVEQLAARLTTRHLVVAALQLELKLASGERHESVIKIPHPTGNVSALFRTLHNYLETVRTQSPIVSLRLSAAPCAPQEHQFSLFETEIRDLNQFAETLGRLSALCGPDCVGTPVPEATHRADAFHLQPPQFTRAARTVAAPASRGLALRRFRPALAAEIEFQPHGPARIRSRALTGDFVDVRGPFRSSGDWWDNHRWAREEWDARTSDGTLCRIFRSGDGCFLEGVYD
jgi:protein ImuB